MSCFKFVRQGALRAQCEEQVKRFIGAKYRKFSTESEAWEFVNEGSSSAGNGMFTERMGLGAGGIDTGMQFRIQAIESTMNLFKQQLTALNGLADKLSSEIEALKTSAVGAVSSPGKAASLGSPYGVKRSFSAGPDFGGQPAKKSSKKLMQREDSVEDSWTGNPFPDEDGTVVYTDGACKDNGRCNGTTRAGLGVFWGHGDSRNLSERLTGRPTNNRAEIHAARRAIEQAQAYGIKNLILHTDSKFLINSITSWIYGWEKNDWKKSSGEKVINKDDFLQLRKVMQDINIKWVHVRGHSGVVGNEEADRLAVAGSLKYSPND